LRVCAVRQRSRRILLLDDEEGFRRSLRAYLEDEGFEALDAESGELALEIVGESRIDAAIVDIRLPGMDGDAFIEYAHRVDSNVRFLICTGSVDYRLPERFVKMGMTDADMFFKPLDDMAALTEALKTILKKKDNHERDSHATDHR
jgi:DNA-binding NtrC family response regulator